MSSPKIYSAIGRIAPVYDFVSWLVGYKKSIEYFISQIPIPIDRQVEVLDAGCGSGPYSLAVLERYPKAKVVSFDLNDKLVRFLEEKAVKKGFGNRLQTFSANIAGPLTELEGGSFDLIITAGVLEYVDQDQAIKNLSRFLKTDGYFFNSPPRNNWWGKMICGVYSCQPYTQAKNLSTFQNNGYVLEKNIKVPRTPSASFKDAHIFKKL
jgi:ubiquinone/menaquinone biosynthesis C-methylase UbiE